MTLSSPSCLRRAVVCAVVLLAVAGCTVPGNVGIPSSAAESAPLPSPVPPTPESEPEAPGSTGPASTAPVAATPTPATPSTATASATSYRQAPWASPVKVTGAPLFSTKKSGYRIDAYEAGRSTSAKDSAWLDATNKKNVWPKGKPVVYVVYVLTNTSSAPAYVGQDGPVAVVKLASMNYLGGIGGLVPFDTAQASRLSVTHTMMSAPPGDKNSHPQLGAGESAATSQVLPLKKNQPYEFSLALSVFPASAATTDKAKKVSFASALYTFT